MQLKQYTVGIPVGLLDVLVWEPEHGARDTVLALHGFPESPWQWEAVAEVLTAHGLRVVAPAQRGYSAGARPEGVEAYAIEHLAADALAVLDHLGEERVHLLGHDWGASVAWWLAAHHADRWSTLTVVSVPHLSAFSEALLTDPDQQARSAYFDLFRQQGKAEDVLLEDGARRLRAMFGSEVSAEQQDRHLALVGERSGLTAALNWYRAMRRYDLPEVVVPTTFLWGEEDMAIARSGAEETASWVAADYRFVPLEGRGHWLPEQEPDLIAGEVLARVG
jgi:pimeloyl-ACP methyl ester carboxylesterase